MEGLRPSPESIQTHPTQQAPEGSRPSTLLGAASGSRLLKSNLISKRPGSRASFFHKHLASLKSRSKEPKSWPMTCLPP
jgi:hypothetical protein